MHVVSHLRSGIMSGGRYVLLHKQRIIEVDLCCVLVFCSCMGYPFLVGSPVSRQTYQYIYILAHLPVRMRFHGLLDSATGVQSWRHGWVWSALQESFVFGCQVVRAMGCSRWGGGRGCLVMRCAVRRVWLTSMLGGLVRALTRWHVAGVGSINHTRRNATGCLTQAQHNLDYLRTKELSYEIASIRDYHKIMLHKRDSPSNCAT
jgi:hypothetical protein